MCCGMRDTRLKPALLLAQIYMEEEHRLQAYFRDAHVADDAYEYSTQTEMAANGGKHRHVRRATLSAIRSVLLSKKRDDRQNINDIVRALDRRDRQGLRETD